MLQFSAVGWGLASRAEMLKSLFKTGDVSPAACSYRLRLARECQDESSSSRRAFAERIGTNARNLQAMENGRSYPRPQFLYAIYVEFGIDPNFILMGQWQQLPSSVLDALVHAATTQPKEPPEPG